jgi:hypothetical protein
MRKVLAALTVFFLAVSPLQASAAVKAGDTCKKAGTTATASGLKFTCVKSGKKLVWNKGVKIAAAAKPSATPAPVATPTPVATATPSPTPTPVVTPTPSPTPTPVVTPTPTPTPTKTFNSLWEKYGWIKPASADAVVQKATDYFKSYTATVRNPDASVKVVAQSGVDQTLINWVKDGATFVARTFAYPKLSREFVDVIAIDKAWLEETYIKEGFSARDVQDRIGGFNAGAPAFGGSTTNTWNYATIQRENLMTRDRAGTAQTAGHEFFHSIQQNYAGTNPGADGSKIPNWFWEGPAMFVGAQTTNTLGIVSYFDSRQTMINRYKNGAAINRTSTLSEIKANTGVIDPYALGSAGAEFLVANVGMEKFLDIYVQLGKGKSFADSFKDATGVELDDFYGMFEEVRATLGFAKS